MAISFKRTQPSKALLPKVSRDLPRTALFNEMQFSNADAPISVTPSGSTMLSKARHLIKALLSIARNPSGKSTEQRALQSAKAKESISVTLSGSVMLSKEKQSSKARCPIRFTEAGISMC